MALLPAAGSRAWPRSPSQSRLRCAAETDLLRLPDSMRIHEPGLRNGEAIEQPTTVEYREAPECVPFSFR